MAMGSRAGRWAGVSADDRRDQRRALLIAAACGLFDEQGLAGLSVRAVCREAGLNSRYFYESFETVDDLLGAAYDEQAAALAARFGPAFEAAARNDPVATRIGIETVLRFITEDQRRAKLLFTEAPESHVLAERRRTALHALIDMAVLHSQASGAVTEPLTANVLAALFGGAMLELATEWAAGRLGKDLDRVVDLAYQISLAMDERAHDLQTSQHSRHTKAGS